AEADENGIAARPRASAARRNIGVVFSASTPETARPVAHSLERSTYRFFPERRDAAVDLCQIDGPDEPPCLPRVDRPCRERDLPACAAAPFALTPACPPSLRSICARPL